MIKPPSLQSERSLVYSGDPALSLPEDPAERERLLSLARETGRWQDLIAEGQQPTIFQVKTMTGTAFEWLCQVSANDKLTEPQLAALALRLSLRSVANLGDYKVKRDDSVEFWMTTTEIIDAIYAAAGDEGRTVVLELGSVLFMRARESPSPK